MVNVAVEMMRFQLVAEVLHDSQRRPILAPQIYSAVDVCYVRVPCDRFRSPLARCC
jgi:hypothetical protein